ncbi:MAG: sigma-70 family RNA polymerase sigma factor [Planctomycetota bacterium]
MSWPLFHETFAQHLPALRARISRQIPERLRSAISPEDVLQEVCLAAARSADRMAGSSAQVIGRWLNTVADTKLVDALRRARRLKRGHGFRQVHQRVSGLFSRLLRPRTTPSGAAQRSDVSAAVRSAVAGLSSDHREVVELFYFHGLSQRQIADRTRRSVAAVNDVLSRSRRQLREVLGDESRFFSDTPVDVRARSRGDSAAST